MKRDTPIAGIMTREPRYVKPGDSLEFVRHIFEEYGFHHVPVAESGKLTGIVSYNDYLRVLRNLLHESHEPKAVTRFLQETSVREVMTCEVYSLRSDDTLETAIKLFYTHQFHALPVVDDAGHLMGIVTTSDLMKVLEEIIAPEKSYNE
jgi:CBS domain-containing protein